MDTSEELHRPGGAAFDDVYPAERLAVVRLAALLVGSQAVAEELAHDASTHLKPNRRMQPRYDRPGRARRPS